MTPLHTVVLRNAFYRDRYRTTLTAFIALAAVNLVLLVLLVGSLAVPPGPRYFPTTSDGRMIRWHALSDPAVPPSVVTQWTATAVTQAFTLDFLHWRTQLQKASGSFTDYGWRTFLAALKKSNNLTTLVQLKMVSDAVVTGAPKIINTAVLEGRYAWKIQMPILVTYTNGTRRIAMPLSVIVIVVRESVTTHPDRIAINNFLPLPQRAAPPTVFAS